MGLKNNIIDLALSTKGDSYFNDGDKLVPERYVIKRHPGQYWGGSSGASPSLLTKTHRIAIDEVRLKEWTVTPQGIIWNANQVGLQLMNPKSESITNSIFNIPASRIYNPIKLFQNLTSPITMIRTARHGLNFFNTDTYEGIQNSLKDKGYVANRLYQLGIEFGHINSDPNPPTTMSKVTNAITSIFDSIGNLLGSGEKIKTLSGIGGPNSVYGVGTTNFFKSAGGGRTDETVLSDKDGKLISSNYQFNSRYNIDTAKLSILSNESYIKLTTTDFTNNTGGARTDETIFSDKDGKLINNVFDSKSDKSYSEMQAEFKNEHSTIYRILNDEDYSPGQGVPTKHQTGTTTSGNSLNDILLYKNQKGLWINNQPQNLLINKYEDIKRIQNQSSNIKTFEKKLDFSGQSGEVYKSNYINNLSNTALEDVFVYKDKAEKLKTNSYNEVYQIEKRLQLNNSNELGTTLDEDSVDQLLSAKYNASNDPDGIDSNGINHYYKRIELPLSGNGGLKLHTKEFNLHGINSKTNVIHPSTEDLIKFRFNWNRPDGTAGFLQLRAYLTGMTDNHKAEWEATRYIGRPDSVQKYDGYNRSFNFSFMVVAMSKAEKDVMWAKLSNLVNKVSPIVSKEGYMSSPFVYLTIGSYILDEPGYLDGLTYTIDDNYPWDIADERPMYINVNTTFIFLGKESPSSVKDYFPMRSF